MLITLVVMLKSPHHCLKRVRDVVSAGVVV